MPYSGFSQVTYSGDDIKSLFEKGFYQEIVDQYAGKPRSLSADELSCVAEAYFHLNDIDDASKYADMAIQKSSKSAKAYYVKGMVLGSKGTINQALTNMKKAVQLSPDYADAYTGMADIYYTQDNITLALENYRKAVSLTPPSEKAFYMIGVIYAGKEDFKNALDTFYVAKSKIVQDKELLVTVLYNIGKMEFDIGRYTKSVEAYEELISYFPDDYYSYEKIVQCYNALGLYDHANTYKTKLYEAYKAGQLAATSIADNFCTDQFKVGSMDVFAYERYEDASCRPFVKNIFYVMNNAGEVDSSVFVDYTPSTDDTTKGEYKFAMIKGITRYTFDRAFPVNVSYARLRPYVEDIIIGKIQPTASN
ncbi:tetratricopeptide repeat protein [Dysgonomonas sp. 521]|nr:tetratricopeptide repeat protein [Dysgonomonas sp. 521]